jgi:hypothetical protein
MKSLIQNAARRRLPYFAETIIDAGCDAMVGCRTAASSL